MCDSVVDPERTDKEAEYCSDKEEYLKRREKCPYMYSFSCLPRDGSGDKYTDPIDVCAHYQLTREYQKMNMDTACKKDKMSVPVKI